MLFRLGIDANLSLGKRKAIDIVVEKGDEIRTIDVKGIKGRTSWPMDNLSKVDKNHFFVFVSFLDRIEDPSIVPEVYVVPSTKVKGLLYRNPKGNRQVMQLSDIRKHKEKFRDKWELLK